MTGILIAPDDPRLAERLWGRVNRTPAGCWEFQGCRSSDGYGAIRVGKMLKTHRVAWAIARGKIPAGLHVLHRCDNPPCINPEHLFLGTNAENMRDRHAKGRTKNLEIGRSKRHAALRSATHCPHGHPYSGSNLRYRKNGARRCGERYRIASSNQRRANAS